MEQRPRLRLEPRPGRADLVLGALLPPRQLLPGDLRGKPEELAPGREPLRRATDFPAPKAAEGLTAAIALPVELQEHLLSSEDFVGQLLHLEEALLVEHLHCPCCCG